MHMNTINMKFKNRIQTIRLVKPAQLPQGSGAVDIYYRYGINHLHCMFIFGTRRRTQG